MFKEVTDLSAENVISLGGINRKTGKKNPESITGYYLGKKTVADKLKGGDAIIYIFQTPKGNEGVWGKTDLNRKMQQVALGALVRASFTGMQPTPKGDMYKFKVEVNDADSIEVSASNENDLQVLEAEDRVSEDEAEDNEDEVELLKAAAQQAAARKAKVAALLKNNKT